MSFNYRLAIHARLEGETAAATAQWFGEALKGQEPEPPPFALKSEFIKGNLADILHLVASSQGGVKESPAYRLVDGQRVDVLSSWEVWMQAVVHDSMAASFYGLAAVLARPSMEGCIGAFWTDMNASTGATELFAHKGALFIGGGTGAPVHANLDGEPVTPWTMGRQPESDIRLAGDDNAKASVLGRSEMQLATNEVQAVSGILEAFVDARSRLYDLYVQLPSEGRPSIDLRIHPASNGATSYTVAGVSTKRPDGREVVWSVSLRSGLELALDGEIELEEGDGYASLFHRSEETSSAAGAAQLIRELADEIASQTWVMGDLPE